MTQRGGLSALNIDSLSQNLNTGANQNGACQAAAVGGIEYVNFAFITKDGLPTGPPAVACERQHPYTERRHLFYNPGDVLRVVLQDTTQGLRITITDLTTGETGFMTASAANGFAEILFDPKGNSCNLQKHNLPANFHPVYATSSEHTHGGGFRRPLFKNRVPNCRSFGASVPKDNGVGPVRK